MCSVVATIGRRGRPHARINYHQVDRSTGKVGVGRRDGKRAFQYVESLNGVTDIHNFSVGNNAKDYSLDCAHKMVIETKVSCQGNDWAIRHEPSG